MVGRDDLVKMAALMLCGPLELRRLWIHMPKLPLRHIHLTLLFTMMFVISRNLTLLHSGIGFAHIFRPY